MNDIAMLLRDTLRDHAETAPGTNGLLTRVRSRSRLVRRRRRLGVAGAGVTAVVLAAGAGPLVINFAGPGGGYAGPGQPSAAPAGSAGTATGEPVPAPSDAPTRYPTFQVVLGPPTFAAAFFPLVPPTGVVPGLGPAQATLDGEDVQLRHLSKKNDGPSIEVRLSNRPPTFESPPGIAVTVESARIRGRIGTSHTETIQGVVTRILIWEEPSAGWVTVRAVHVETGALTRYVEGLMPGQIDVRQPFTFGLAPVGMVVDQIEPSVMTFRPPGVPAGGSFAGKLAVFYNADASGDPATWPLRVGGQPASITAQDDGRSLQVSLGAGEILVVQVPANVEISDADLSRFAAGTTVTAAAQLGRG